MGRVKKEELRVRRSILVNVDAPYDEGRTEGFRQGIAAAAAFAGEWDNHLTGTKYRFEDIILAKFNQITKKQMRRKRAG